jgi:hypothetical protein
MMTGPAGKVMLMPEEDPNTDYIMVATGTGIARTVVLSAVLCGRHAAAAVYKGEAWLFLSPTATPCCTMMSGARCQGWHPKHKNFRLTMPCLVNKKQKRQDVHSG